LKAKIRAPGLLLCYEHAKSYVRIWKEKKGKKAFVFKKAFVREVNT